MIYNLKYLEMINSIIDILNYIETTNIPDQVLNYILITDNNKNTLLHQAIENEFTKTVGIIINKNVNFNIQNEEGNTALHLIIKKIDEWSQEFNYKLINYLYYMKSMIEKGSNLNIINKEGKSGYYLMKNYLEKQDYYGNTILHMLIGNEYLFIFKFLVEKFKPNLDLQNNYGDTVLHIASILYSNNCNMEFLTIINLILKNGASEFISNKLNILPEYYINRNLIY